MTRDQVLSGTPDVNINTKINNNRNKHRVKIMRK